MTTEQKMDMTVEEIANYYMTGDTDLNRVFKVRQLVENHKRKRSIAKDFTPAQINDWWDDYLQICYDMQDVPEEPLDDWVRIYLDKVEILEKRHYGV